MATVQSDGELVDVGNGARPAEPEQDPWRPCAATFILPADRDPAWLRARLQRLCAELPGLGSINLRQQGAALVIERASQVAIGYGHNLYGSRRSGQSAPARAPVVLGGGEIMRLELARDGGDSMTVHAMPGAPQYWGEFCLLLEALQGELSPKVSEEGESQDPAENAPAQAEEPALPVAPAQRAASGPPEHRGQKRRGRGKSAPEPCVRAVVLEWYKERVPNCVSADDYEYDGKGRRLTMAAFCKRKGMSCSTLKEWMKDYPEARFAAELEEYRKELEKEQEMH